MGSCIMAQASQALAGCQEPGILGMQKGISSRSWWDTPNWTIPGQTCTNLHHTWTPTSEFSLCPSCECHSKTLPHGIQAGHDTIAPSVSKPSALPDPSANQLKWRVKAPSSNRSISKVLHLSW